LILNQRAEAKHGLSNLRGVSDSWRKNPAGRKPRCRRKSNPCIIPFANSSVFFANLAAIATFVQPQLVHLLQLIAATPH
jgi:hypothetical protein